MVVVVMKTVVVCVDGDDSSSSGEWVVGYWRLYMLVDAKGSEGYRYY